MAASLAHVSASYAWSEKCTVVGVGVSSEKIGAASYMMYYKFTKKWTNYFAKAAKKISSTVKKKAGKKKW